MARFRYKLCDETVLKSAAELVCSFWILEVAFATDRCVGYSCISATLLCVKYIDTIAKEEWLLFGIATFTLHGVGLVVVVIVRSVIQFFISL
jgi:hypothetical protein